MQILDGFRKSLGLAMAGKKSPWGNGGGNGAGSGGGSDAPSGESGGSDGGGPRNPWLPGGGGDGKRKSASIEDIFKNRGPEGPRRKGGGPGGPNFRLPERPGGKSWGPLLIGAAVALWVLVSSAHQIAPREEAVVSWFGGK